MYYWYILPLCYGRISDFYILHHANFFFFFTLWISVTSELKEIKGMVLKQFTVHSKILGKKQKSQE